MAHPIRSLYPCLATLLVGASAVAAVAQQAPSPRAGATPPAAISGRLLDDKSGPVAHAAVRLVMTSAGGGRSGPEIERAVTEADASGAFTFSGVPQGKYTLRVLIVPAPAGYGLPPGVGAAGLQPAYVPPAVDPVLWAETPVSVGRSDVTGLVVALRRGLHISGRVTFDSSSPVPSADARQRIAVTVFPLEHPDERRGQGGVVQADGTFVLQGLGPGRYRIACDAPDVTGATGSPWRLETVTRGGRHLADARLTLQATDASGLVLTMTTRH